MFIVLMIRGKGLDDLVMIQELQRVPGILCQDQVGFFEHVQRPEANVLEVADGRRNEV
jgi:hypothetical protein